MEPSQSQSFYRAFEDRHRGSRDLIKQRLQQYAPFLQPLAELYPQGPALDLGCGRGEWLEVAAEAGFNPHGVDLDAGMLSGCAEHGLSASLQDLSAALQACDDESLCIISAFHVVEHIPFAAVQSLVHEAMRVLKPGGLLILETPNPENLVVGTVNFYLDPTHIRPIPPLLLSFLTQHTGFIRNKIVRLQEDPNLHHKDQPLLADVLQGVSPDYAVVAQKPAPQNLLAAFDSAFEQDYGLTLHALANHFDASLQRHFAALQAELALVRDELQKARKPKRAASQSKA
jgi:O-antigen chain-terminating methyltransferase